MKPARWIAGSLLLLAVLCTFGWGAEHLLLGWLYFPARVLPRMTVDPPAAIVGAAGVVLFVLVLHATMRWLRPSTSWSIGSTVALATLVLMLFVAGTAMVGVVHQAIWLALGRQNTTGKEEAVMGVTEAARHAAGQHEATYELKNYAFVVQNFHDVFNSLPPGGTMTADGRLLHGWMTFAGPFAVISNENVDFATPWNKPPNDRLFKCNFSQFVNPSIPGPRFDAEGYGLTHYAGNVHVLPICVVEPVKDNSNGSLQVAQVGQQGKVRNWDDVSDGTSNTLLIGTVTERFKPWAHPSNVRDPSIGLNRSPEGFAAPPGWRGAAFAMCDGSVRTISRHTDPEVLRQLATPAGGESATPDGLDGR
jgi:hypothetical protein